MLSLPSISINPSPIEATETGKYNMKVYFNDVSLDNPQRRQPTKTVPLRLMPGNKETICSKPMMMASL